MKETLFSQDLYVLSLSQKSSLETQRHGSSLCGSTAGVSGNGEFWGVGLQEATACAFASVDLSKETTCEFFEGDWMSS